MNARSATASMDDAFVIGTDPTLSQRVRREMIDTLVANGGVSAADAEREIASRDFAATFERFFGAMGLSPHRLPDVFAAHLLAMWSIVHQQSLPDRVVAEGVRTQFETLLRGRPEARNAEQRQLIGEALLCESVLSLEAREDAQARDDRKELAQMAESAQRNMLQRQGINLRKTRLGAQGMRRA
ncbi:hypothetical protein sS8_3375 [Methylocaldum marinum]|uniref:Uncharacterized protein n=1 Tax=Methylocaldum marinum TaxID=1432792 RepID=A0A250KUG5_9GAMM|nr:DUF6683 family protein [Methylocaldum marinum]BBA35313.1 hypothetical protein sS8_3375 [Methylocaldum marinum]